MNTVVNDTTSKRKTLTENISSSSNDCNLNATFNNPREEDDIDLLLASPQNNMVTSDDERRNHLRSPRLLDNLSLIGVEEEDIDKQIDEDPAFVPTSQDLPIEGSRFF